MADPIRLGIIGANPDRSWASTAHLPAVKALEEIELVAVATTRRESAETSREKYGASRAYADPAELIADPEIEAVTVTVKVPGHRDLVQQALEAGKHVYCEWPLTEDTASAIALHDLARRAGRETIIGLQAARSAPIMHAAEIVASGELGELLSATLESTGPFGGAKVPAYNRYVADDVNGANILTITTGHALDTLCAVAGEIAELSATLGSRYPEVEIADTGERIPATSPDQVSVTGTLAGGAVLTAYVQGGVDYDPGFRIEVRGKQAALYISARPSITAATVELELVGVDGVRRPIAVPAQPGSSEVPAGPPAFVARLYRDFAGAIRRGERNGPDFAHAIRRHRLLDAIRASAASGSRQGLD